MKHYIILDNYQLKDMSFIHECVEQIKKNENMHFCSERFQTTKDIEYRVINLFGDNSIAYIALPSVTGEKDFSYLFKNEDIKAIFINIETVPKEFINKYLKDFATRYPDVELVWKPLDRIPIKNMIKVLKKLKLILGKDVVMITDNIRFLVIRDE